MPPADHNESLPPLTKLCDICCTLQPRLELLQPCSCGLHYCPSCLKECFLLASRDASLMPPSCCSGMIQIHLALPLLSAVEAAQYRAKFDEWRSPLKLYCPVPWCSTFIPDRLLPQQEPKSSKPESSDVPKSSSKRRALVAPSIKRSSSKDSSTNPSELEHVQCPNCRARICLKCKQLCHPQSPCADFVERKTRDVLNKLGYKSCPSCGHGVRRMFGCNHMACLCGAHFCWGCRRPIGQCEESEECLVDADDDCAGLEQDEQDELMYHQECRILELVGGLDKDVDAYGSFRGFCEYFFDLCLKDSQLWAEPQPEITFRRRQLLVVLEDIAADAINVDSNNGNAKIVATLGSLAAEFPDAKGVSGADTLRIIIALGQESTNAPVQNASGDPEREELVDLDRRDAVERDLDLGMEPADQDERFSACKHRFQSYELPKLLQQGQVATDGMECHKCWRKVQLKKAEPMTQAIPASRLRYALRSTSQALALSAAIADTSAWSCVSCHIMFCGGCAHPSETNL